MGKSTYLTSPHGEQGIETTPCRRDTSRVGLVAAEVQIRGEEEDGREHHGEGLEGAGMLGEDEGCEEGWGDRVLWSMILSLHFL